MTPDEFIATLAPAFDLTSGPYVPRKEVVVRIRSEIALAIKAGVVPAGTKVSVRGVVRVEIIAWAGPVFSDEYTEAILDHTVRWDRPNYERLAPALDAAVRALERIADRHNYNRSRSEVDHFDVGYYLTCDARAVEAEARSGLEQERNPDLGALRHRASEAAARLGAACTRSMLSCGIGAAGEWALKRIIALDERAAGRTVAYDKRRRCWFPVDPSVDDDVRQHRRAMLAGVTGG